MKAKLESKIVKIAKALEQVNLRLASPDFVGNAPAELVEQNRASAKEYQESIEKLRAFSSGFALGAVV
jgi:valyl-tRNA synthetase